MKKQNYSNVRLILSNFIDNRLFSKYISNFKTVKKTTPYNILDILYLNDSRRI